MARQNNIRDTLPVLSAAEQWIKRCLIQDGSIFSPDEQLWTDSLIEEVYEAFVKHPDIGSDSFMTKLKRQLAAASGQTQRLTAEMLWALLLFPSNIKARTKRHQVTELWNMSGQTLRLDHPMLQDATMVGIGSGGTGFNNYRPYELQYLIELARSLKRQNQAERSAIMNYESFLGWIEGVPREGNRQFRHMLRYFAFPDRVERISSNNDRISILEAFGRGSARDMADWTDRQLDDSLIMLRNQLLQDTPVAILDFYESPWREKWAKDRKIRTPEGEVTVTVPGAEDESEEPIAVAAEMAPAAARQSFQVQARLAHIGAIMGFKVWLPRADRGRVSELLTTTDRAAILENLPLNYDGTTLDTIELIDVLWLKGRSMARAFEVEQTTAVYSGLLRMADLLALQPNMDIRLHIVAPEERRDKVFREMQRPVFSLLERGPLSKSCTFISYESVNSISSMPHLAHMHDSIIREYEEAPESN